MRDQLKSFVRLSWAAAVYGAEHFAARARSGTTPPGPAPEPGLDVIVGTIRRQLGPGFQAVYQAGEDLQADWIDGLADAYRSRGLKGTAATFLERMGEAVAFVRPDEKGGLARQELVNRIEVYRLVLEGRRTTAAPSEGPVSLTEAVEQALALDSHRQLWAFESLGHAYAESALASSEAPRGLLRNPELPVSSLPMLHAGMGLAFAEHLLRELDPRTPPARVRVVLERFLTLCRDNSRETQRSGGYDSLGLVARHFYPELVPVLEQGLSALGDVELHGMFWHGVGRACYFLPIHFLPGYASGGHALELAWRETPHQLAWNNAVAGVGTAVALTNMAHPRVLENLLRKHGKLLYGSRFSEGVASAVIIRSVLTPDPEALVELLRHRPDPRVAELWKEMVRTPCEEVLTRAAEGGDPLPFLALNLRLRRESSAETGREVGKWLR